MDVHFNDTRAANASAAKLSESYRLHELPDIQFSDHQRTS